MKKSTHLRIANLVAQELELNLSSQECAYLRGGSIEPDKWRDYPHHFGVNQKLKNWIIKSRKYFLEENTTAHLESLGITFHYLADKWTLFSGSAQQHAEWEDKIDKCHIIDDINGIILDKLSPHQESQQQYLSIVKDLYKIPRTNRETLEIAFRTRPSENGLSFSAPEIDFNIAFRICLVVGMSIRNLTTPPNELVKALNLLVPWQKSAELSKRTTPELLKVSFNNIVASVQLLEEQMNQKRDGLKSPPSNFFKAFIFRHKMNAAIKTVEHSIKTKKLEFEQQVENFIKEYSPYTDWYYWGEKYPRSLWGLIDLYKNTNNESVKTQIYLQGKIVERTFKELSDLKKHGYQIVSRGKTTIGITFSNPTDKVLTGNIVFYSSDNCSIEHKNEPLSLDPNWSERKQIQAEITNEDKITSYLVEGVFNAELSDYKPPIERYPSYEKWGVEETRPIVIIPNGKRPIMQTAPPISFIKILVVSETGRNLWREASLNGQKCGVLGCEGKIEWKCPNCNLSFCVEHIPAHKYNRYCIPVIQKY